MKKIVTIAASLCLGVVLAAGCTSRAPDHTPTPQPNQNTEQKQDAAKKPEAAKPAENKPAADVPVK